jgi:hypothetical protein
MSEAVRGSRVPGQHHGGYCAGCGCEWDARVLACRTCSNRHQYRRRRRSRSLIALSPAR